MASYLLCHWIRVKSCCITARPSWYWHILAYMMGWWKKMEQEWTIWKNVTWARLLERLSYAVFGLGDRRYREFNYAAAWWKLSSWSSAARFPTATHPCAAFQGIVFRQKMQKHLYTLYLYNIYIILYISYIYMDTYILVHSFPFFMTWCNPSVCIRLSHESKCSCKVATVETQLVVRQESSMHDFNLWVPRRFSVWAWVMTSMTSAPSSELCFLTHGNSWKILLAACSFQI